MRMISSTKYNMIKDITSEVGYATEFLRINDFPFYDPETMTSKLRWEISWASTTEHSADITRKFIAEVQNAQEFADYLNKLELEVNYDLEEPDIEPLRCLMNSIHEGMKKYPGFKVFTYRYYIEKVLEG